MASSSDVPAAYVYHQKGHLFTKRGYLSLGKKDPKSENDLLARGMQGAGRRWVVPGLHLGVEHGLL